MSAIRDLDELYQACPSDNRLVDCTDISAKLTVAAMQDIKPNVMLQPYVMPNFAPSLVARFPKDA